MDAVGKVSVFATPPLATGLGPYRVVVCRLHSVRAVAGQQHPVERDGFTSDDRDALGDNRRQLGGLPLVRLDPLDRINKSAALRPCQAQDAKSQ